MAVTKNAFGQPKPTLSSPEHVQSADVANDIIQSTEAITDMWDPFIAKVKRFTDMVDKISHHSVLISDSNVDNIVTLYRLRRASGCPADDT